VKDPDEFNPERLGESSNMTAEDFGHDGVPLEPRVTIKSIEKQRDGLRWGLLHFQEKWAKPLKLNATSKKALKLMFSETDYRQWIGKRIDLYVMRGNFKEKKTAVRIKGSPDISRAFSFKVKSFGGGYDVYNLQPTGNNVVLGPGYVRFGKSAGHWGKPFSDFTTELLGELVNMAEEYLTANAEKMKPKAKEDLVANLKEIREEIAARSKPTEPTSEAAPVAEDNEPVL
jgi:hypothetical protein